MMDIAFESGVDLLDTARAYGESEAVIGSLLSDNERTIVRVVTKLAPDVWQVGLPAAEAVSRVETSLILSMQALRVSCLDTLLLHREEQRTCCDGRLWDALKTAQDEGRIGKLGISAATPDQAMNALSDPDVEVMQVATSLVDQRLVRRGFFEAARRAGKEIHVRSVFLQGVAFLTPNTFGEHLKSVRSNLNRIAALAEGLEIHKGMLWLLYARTLPANRLVLGTETEAQLRDNLAGFDLPIPAEVTQLASDLEPMPDALLDPALWLR
jgi:aryl-alcohol dehydrogenase-like predicted oxidoreductase